MRYTLRCTRCGIKYGQGYRSQVCRACGGILEVEYEARGINRAGSSFWNNGLLPDGVYRHYEVGNTKTIRSEDDSGLFFKLEIENPTGSFKDRGSVIEMAKAAEYGYNEVACASTGNMAYSVAYYAKLYGMKAKIYISRDANHDKIKAIRDVGNSDIAMVNGDFTEAQRMAELYAKRKHAFLAGDYCYRKEGQGTLSLEVLEGIRNVSRIFVPVGNATLISGMYKYFKRIDKGRVKPALVAVQAERCMPLVRAFKSKEDIRYERPRTKADAIAVGMPTYGRQALDALIATGGTALSVTEKEMLAEQKRFYRQYGLIVELAAVSGIAAWRKLKAENSSSVIIISGRNV